jgi:HPt (histidine-containing phosphotransfer) domain-containing protein
MTIDRGALDAVIAENFGGAWDIFRDTATCFLDGLDENMRNFRRAFSAQDSESMVQISHRIKGEASLFHIPSVHSYFKEIEANARKGLLPTSQAFDEAEQSLTALGGELRMILAEQVNRSA